MAQQSHYARQTNPKCQERDHQCYARERHGAGYRLPGLQLDSLEQIRISRQSIPELRLGRGFDERGSFDLLVSYVRRKAGLLMRRRGTGRPNRTRAKVLVSRDGRVGMRMRETVLTIGWRLEVLASDSEQGSCSCREMFGTHVGLGREKVEAEKETRSG